MFNSFTAQRSITWRLVRAHLCTVGVSVGFHATWRSPRDAFQFGGLQYGLVLTFVMVVVTLPLALLELAIGQLSQQDAIGVWRAVPFFRGVGYIKLITSYLVATYSAIYMSLTVTYFFHAISNSLPFLDCAEVFVTHGGPDYPLNASACLNHIFMASVIEKPEYFINVAFILVFLWTIMPFILFNPVKLMKRIISAFGIFVIIMIIIIVSLTGDSANFVTFASPDNWKSFLEPNIWHKALVQALLTSHVASGFLISAGDTIYTCTNVVWTAIAFVGVNVLSTWLGLWFWFSITKGHDRDISVFAVLIEAYKIGEQAETNIEWPILIFFLLIISGFITLLTFLFPIYDHCRRVAGLRWRVLSITGSILSGVFGAIVLALRTPAVTLLDDYTVPLLVSISTVTEIVSFLFIYDWRVLVEDVEFLSSRELEKIWATGWCIAPCIIIPFTGWWMVMIFLQEDGWTDPPWAAISIIITFTLAILVIVALASIIVVRQVQYDTCAKIKSAFKPSRHWGPRDPITHYYWLARRQDYESGYRYRRRRLGHLMGELNYLNRPVLSHCAPKLATSQNLEKKRSNSDDWVYTIYRKKMLGSEEKRLNISFKRSRSKSLDLNVCTKKAKKITKL